MLRKRRSHLQSSAERMRYRQASRMQVEPARSRSTGQMGCCLAILRVAENRCADRGAMRAQLVRAPGDRHQREPTGLRSDAVDHLVVGVGASPPLVVGTDALAAKSGHLRKLQVDASL